MSRNRLHLDKVDEFKTWLKENGWTERKTRSCWEVFRMTHPEHNTLIVHCKMRAQVHCTLHGIAETMFSRWLRDRGY